MAKMKSKNKTYVTWEQIYSIIIIICSLIGTIFFIKEFDFVFMEFFKVLILLICIIIGPVAVYELLRGD